MVANKVGSLITNRNGRGLIIYWRIFFKLLHLIGYYFNPWLIHLNLYLILAICPSYWWNKFSSLFIVFLPTLQNSNSRITKFFRRTFLLNWLQGQWSSILYLILAICPNYWWNKFSTFLLYFYWFYKLLIIYYKIL